MPTQKLNESNNHKLFEREGMDVILANINSRESYVINKESNSLYCLAPTPDVTLTASDGVSLSSQLLGKSAGIGEENGTGALDLGGRSPSVLVTRELMYRACELTLNLRLSNEEAITAYKMFLKALVEVTANISGSGNAPLADPAVLGSPNLVLPDSTKEGSGTIDGASDEFDSDDGDDSDA